MRDRRRRTGPVREHRTGSVRLEPAGHPAMNDDESAEDSDDAADEDDGAAAFRGQPAAFAYSRLPLMVLPLMGRTAPFERGSPVGTHGGLLAKSPVVVDLVAGDAPAAVTGPRSEVEGPLLLDEQGHLLR